jgi:hypothetical protein
MIVPSAPSLKRGLAVQKTADSGQDIDGISEYSKNFT